MLNNSGLMYRRSRLIETSYDLLNYIEKNQDKVSENEYEDIYFHVLKSRINDLLEQLDCINEFKIRNIG